jgi:flagellar basal body-associated protein FliL
MSEKAEKKPEAAAPAAAAPAAAKGEGKASKAGLLTKTPVLLGGVMVIEAIVLLGGFKMLGSKPPAATGATLAAADDSSEGGSGEKGTAKKGKTVEVPLVDFKALNKANGRTFLYDVSIFIVTKAANEDKVKDTLKDSKALIEDRIRTIIGESDPEKLGGGTEPGLETLRRQVKYQLDRILGEGIVEEILVPRCIPFRTDY